MEQQHVPKQHQLDQRWIGRYRELVSYDSYWWLTWAGPFIEEEQQQWDRLFTLPLDEANKGLLGTLMKTSRERELAAALAEQREPRLHYPAIEIEDIRRRITAHQQLDADIRQHEPNSIVRCFYQGAIEEELNYLHLIEATHEGDTTRFWQMSRHLFHFPTKEEMADALAPVKLVLRQGLATPKAADTAQRFKEFLRTHLHLALEISDEEQHKTADALSQSKYHLSAQAAKQFFETVLQESGYEGWQVAIDLNATNARVEQGARCLFLPEKRFWLSEIKHLFIHELAGHVARCVAGERSSLGLLGLHTKNASPTDEGIALFHERQVLASHGQQLDVSGMQLSIVALGLACGVMTPPQTFFSLCTFFEFFALLHYLLHYPNLEKQKAQTLAQSYAISRCLRIYRGVPDLTQPGICYLEDTVHLYGLHLIEQAVAVDATVLDRLAVGNCALEQLPDLQALSLRSAPQPLMKLAYASDLDEYILSFDVQSVE